MKKTKLAFLLPSLAGGGAERVAATLIPHLAERYDLHVVLLENRQVYSLPPEISVTSLSGELSGMRAHLLRMPLHLFQLRKLWRTLKPDVVLSFMEQANLLNVLSRCGLSHRCVLSQRCDPASQYAGKGIVGKLIRLFSKWFYKRADRVLAVSNGIRLSIIDEYSLLPDQVDSIGNPVNLSAVQKASSDVTGVFSHISYLIHVGRLDVRTKGHDILLWAFSTIHNEHPDLHLVLLGEGEDRSVIEDMVERLGLQERIHLVGWCENIYSWLSCAKAFLFPSRWEGCPNVVLEALACRCPVIATDCPYGPREILQDGEYGVLVPMDDPDALAQATLDLLADDKRRASLCEKGPLRAEMFSVEQIVGQYVQVIDAVVGV